MVGESLKSKNSTIPVGELAEMVNNISLEASDSEGSVEFAEKTEKVMTEEHMKKTELCDNLIDKLNHLQEVLASSGETLDISLPEIVVIGSQSAGKSSVLESIVGKEFLPRGKDVVTRRPTIVKLHPSEKEYAVIDHKPSEKITNFQDIIRTIDLETQNDPGPEGFSSNPIRLSIYSPKVLKLRLVDLPGLIKTAVGNQPADSVAQVEEMVLEYIRKPNVIIVAVCPATQDLSTTDSLEIAHRVDPDRVRTIGVVTKLDLMDDGTDARETLENKKIPLKRGFVGVINRNQKEIEEKKDIEYLWEKEKKFFQRHEAYKHIAKNMGSNSLRKKLSEELKVHIVKCLPNVRMQIQSKLSELRKELKKYDSLRSYKEDGDGSNVAKFHLLKLVHQFIDEYIITVQGYSDRVRMDELSAGALIHGMFQKDLQSNLILPKLPTEQELTFTTANIHAIRNMISLPSLALDAACKNLLKEYEAPIENFINKVAGTLSENANKVAEKIFADSYPQLKQEILISTHAATHQAAENTKNALEEHLNAEKCYVNYHIEDIGENEFDEEVISEDSPKSYLEVPNDKEIDKICFGAKPKIAKSGPKDNRKQEKNKVYYARKENYHLARLIQKYLENQRKQTIDVCIKYTVYFLIEKVLQFNQFKLVPSVLYSKTYEDLIFECSKDFLELEELEKNVENLESALQIVQTF